MAKDLAHKKVTVHFNPDNVDIVVAKGENLLQAAIAAGVRLHASCGGSGTCGTCKVVIEKGDAETTRTTRISDEEYGRGVRQACQTRVLTDLTVYVPVESRLERAIVAREGKNVSAALATGWRFKPPLSKFYLELPPPTMTDNASDLSRLLRGLKQQYKLKNVGVDFDILKTLPGIVRRKNWRVTVTLLTTAVREGRKDDGRRLRIVNVEPGDTRERHYALAFDIGTTTVCGQLLDLNKGKILADSIEFNGQIPYGQDVITRIAQAQKPGGLKKLQTAVIDTINKVIDNLLAKSQVNLKDIGHMTLAGNTTMTELLLGVDPQYIRLAPYIPAANFFPPVEVRSLGIHLRKGALIFVFPAVSSYVGGDIVSGVIGTGMYQRNKLTFFLDIGTNGEIVIGNSDWLVTASCSAGPAFEGGGIRHGIVATDGAIEDFDIDEKTYEPKIGVIGKSKPKGICGSGLINTIARMMEAGVITRNGKFQHNLPTKRIRTGEDGYEYVMAWAPDTQIGRDIVLTEIDIENLIRAKAAMYAGCQTLSKSVGTSCAAFDQVIIAGAFGSHLNIKSAITIGLLPELPEDRFIFVGNGSLLGARLVSFSTDLLDDSRRIAAMMTNIELSDSADFMDSYTAAMFLPHTHADVFPEVTRKLSERQKNTGKRK
ncbi:MAG: ASKHA domain-containing protein [Dehalococcoidales bacterium]|nr:ASKHA domain-containing protein [Dehalococcoidales bacterium]